MCTHRLQAEMIAVNGARYSHPLWPSNPTDSRGTRHQSGGGCLPLRASSDLLQRSRTGRAQCLDCEYRKSRQRIADNPPRPFQALITFRRSTLKHSAGGPQVEAFSNYRFAPKHTIASQLLSVRHDKQERADYDTSQAQGGVPEGDDLDFEEEDNNEWAAAKMSVSSLDERSRPCWPVRATIRMCSFRSDAFSRTERRNFSQFVQVPVSALRQIGGCGRRLPACLRDGPADGNAKRAGSAIGDQ
jgi:hypothetical protein